MTSSTSEGATGPASDIGGFELELKELLTANVDAPAGMSSLRDRATETRDKLLELSGSGITFRLNADEQQHVDSFVLAAARHLTRAAKSTEGEVFFGCLADALIELEAARHVTRDGVDDTPIRTSRGSGSVVMTRRDAVDQVEEWLPRLGRSEQAAVLGIDKRDFSRWRSETPEVPASRRSEMSLELVGILRHSWTNEGVIRWFEREHPALGDRRPIDVIDDVDWEHRLLDAARSGRALTAS